MTCHCDIFFCINFYLIFTMKGSLPLLWLVNEYLHYGKK